MKMRLSVKDLINIHDDVLDLDMEQLFYLVSLFGQGAIIGAGSVIAKDIPPYAVVANDRIIKYRFNDKIIQELIKIDLSQISPEDIKKNRSDYLTPLNDENYMNILNHINTQGEG